MGDITKAFPIYGGLSLDDVIAIFEGSLAPDDNNEVGPIGSIYLRTNGEAWIKYGAGNTQWVKIHSTKNNESASTDPSASNDNTEGYSVGSQWWDTTADKAWICLDATTAAAIWTVISEIAEQNWLSSYLPNTPSVVARLFGMGINGFNPGHDIRITELRVQYYSEHISKSSIRVRVYRYDANATTDRLILTVSETPSVIGYHALVDDTPDETYWDLDSSAGDTIWVEIDKGDGNPADRVSEITINVKHSPI